MPIEWGSGTPVIKVITSAVAADNPDVFPTACTDTFPQKEIFGCFLMFQRCIAGMKILHLPFDFFLHFCEHISADKGLMGIRNNKPVFL